MNELAAELRRWVVALERRQAFDPRKLAALLRRIADYLEDTCVDTQGSTASQTDQHRPSSD